MITIENFADKVQIISFLNSSVFLDSIILAMVVISTIIVFILLHHWSIYTPQRVVKLEHGEKVVEIFRKHWFIFLADVIFFLFLAFVPLLTLLLPESYTVWFDQVESFLVILYIAWIDFIFFGLLIKGTNFFLDTWVLTTTRLIDIEQKGLFSRDIAELSLENIQDIRVEISGIINSLIGMGNIQIQSSGVSKEFFIRNVAMPEYVKNKISQSHYGKLKEVKAVKVVE